MTPPSLEILSPSASQISLNYADSVKLAGAVMSELERQEATVGEGVAAVALVLGRLLSPLEKLSDQESLKFVEDLLSWSGAYFAEGEAN